MQPHVRDKVLLPRVARSGCKGTPATRQIRLPGTDGCEQGIRCVFLDYSHTAACYLFARWALTLHAWVHLLVRACHALHAYNGCSVR
jgi:hypothetical protein